MILCINDQLNSLLPFFTSFPHHLHIPWGTHYDWWTGWPCSHLPNKPELCWSSLPAYFSLSRDLGAGRLPVRPGGLKALRRRPQRLGLRRHGNGVPAQALLRLSWEQWLLQPHGHVQTSIQSQELPGPKQKHRWVCSNVVWRLECSNPSPRILGSIPNVCDLAQLWAS